MNESGDFHQICCFCLVKLCACRDAVINHKQVEVLTRAAFTFGTRVASFKAAAEKMGAEMVKHGDAGYRFNLIGGYQMQILVWEGDEEFPPNAQILYSDNFADGFAAEDRVVAGDILISTIKSNM